MAVDFTRLYSESARQMKPSAIRQLAHLVNQSDVVSLAGGWPSPELFPIEEIARICADVLGQEGKQALQYGPTGGDKRLLNFIRQRAVDAHQVELAEENLMITTGGQQGIFLLGLVFLSPGDVAAVEIPSYVGSLGAFDACRADVVGIPMDDHGLHTDQLEEEIKKLHIAGRHLKLIYVIPDFQNPSGVTMSLERRQRLVELADHYDFLIIEDSPYADLRYEGEPLPPIYALDKAGRTIFLGSFSKILAPVRLGWLIAPADVVNKLVVAKQHIDLCSPSLTQSLVYHFCQQGLLDEQIEKTRRLYQHKRDVMLNALEQHMPAGVEWTRPQGGMFTWVTMPEHVDTGELFYAAIEEKVAFVIGSAFYPAGGHAPKNAMRLSFATPSPQAIELGIQRLAVAVKKFV